MQQPYTLHERTGHELLPGKSRIFKKLIETEQDAKSNKMKLNYKKTKLMVCNLAKTKDFLPRFTFNNDELEVVEETRLLGLIIISDLSWSSNTNYITNQINQLLLLL